MSFPKIVLVLGAGATRAEAQADKIIPCSEYPPLDKDFFDIAMSNPDPKDPKWHIPSHDATITFADAVKARNLSNDLKVIEKFYGKSLTGCTMENVFNHIYDNVLPGGAPARPQEAFWTLIKVFRAVLARTTDFLKCTAGYPMYDIIQAAWNKSGDDLTIISFNQDLLAEKALERLHIRREASWNIAKCYAAPFTLTWPHVAESDFELLFQQTNCVSSIMLLKLHGSFNWYGQIGTPVPSRVGDEQHGFSVSRRRHIGLDNVPISERLRCDGSGYTWPIIVPPMFDKSDWVSDFLKKNVWREARCRLQDSDAVVFWGYSFPEADSFAGNLFKESLFCTGKSQRVIVANISKDPVEKRAQNLLSPPNIVFCETPEKLVACLRNI